MSTSTIPDHTHQTGGRPARAWLGPEVRPAWLAFAIVVESPAQLEAALDARLKEFALAWNTSSS